MHSRRFKADDADGRVLRITLAQLLQHIKVFCSGVFQQGQVTRDSPITKTATTHPHAQPTTAAATSQTTAALAVPRPQRAHVAADDGGALPAQLRLLRVTATRRGRGWAGAEHCIWRLSICPRSSARK